MERKEEKREQRRDEERREQKRSEEHRRGEEMRIDFGKEKKGEKGGRTEKRVKEHKGETEKLNALREEEVRGEEVRGEEVRGEERRSGDGVLMPPPDGRSSRAEVISPEEMRRRSPK